MSNKFLLSLCLSLSLMGCAGLVAPDSFEQRVAYVDAGITAVAKTAKERFEVGSLSKEESAKVAQALRQASLGSDMAKGIVKPDGKICSDELTCLKFAQEQLLKLEKQLQMEAK